MFILMIGLSAVGIVAGVVLGLARRNQQLSLRRALGLPEGAFVTAESAQRQRVLRELAATEARIRKSSPYLSAAQRLELAANLVRARGPLRAEDHRTN